MPIRSAAKHPHHEPVLRPHEGRCDADHHPYCRRRSATSKQPLIAQSTSGDVEQQPQDRHHKPVYQTAAHHEQDLPGHAGSLENHQSGARHLAQNASARNQQGSQGVRNAAFKAFHQIRHHGHLLSVISPSHPTIMSRRTSEIRPHIKLHENAFSMSCSEDLSPNMMEATK